MIAQIDETDAGELAPWFIERMSSDTWGFALLTSHGMTFAVQSILAVERDETGSAWLKVMLMERGQAELHRQHLPGFVVCAVCDRDTASVRLDSIVAALEVWDT